MKVSGGLGICNVTEELCHGRDVDQALFCEASWSEVRTIVFTLISNLGKVFAVLVRTDHYYPPANMKLTISDC